MNRTAVNLGCGSTVAPGWINLDNSPGARLAQFPWLRWLLWKTKVLSDQHYNVRWPKNVIVRDLRRKLPFDSASIDCVYTSHVLEHLTRADARNLLSDIYRILKNGGLLRVVVPDLAFGARRYLAALERNVDDTAAAPELLNWLALSKPGLRAPHLWMYDAPTLRRELVAVGFDNVVVREHKTGSLPDCELLDNRPDESLHMEAEKPRNGEVRGAVS